jgi:hypothetical protein
VCKRPDRWSCRAYGDADTQSAGFFALRGSTAEMVAKYRSRPGSRPRIQRSYYRGRRPLFEAVTSTNVSRRGCSFLTILNVLSTRRRMRLCTPSFRTACPCSVNRKKVIRWHEMACCNSDLDRPLALLAEGWSFRKIL